MTIRLTLKSKLLLPLLFMLTGVGGAYSYFWVDRMAAQAMATFEANGNRAVESIAVPLASALWEFDERAVTKDMAALETWDGFVFAQVVDNSGVFATFPADVETPADWETDLRAGAIAGGEMRFGMNRIFVAPLTHEVHGAIGHVVAVFSQEEMAASLAGTNRQAALYAAVAILAIALVIYAIAVSVVRPVSRVTALVERVANGDLVFRTTDTLRGDEVGRLAQAVEVFRRNASELVSANARAQAAETIAEMALIDPLTRLASRRGLDAAMSDLPSPETGCRGHFAVFSFDLDEFKEINDIHGHAAGDMVLKAVANRLESAFPSARCIARTGGDQFVVLDTVDDRASASERGRNAVEALSQPIDGMGFEIAVRASLGISVEACDAFVPETALLDSDQALHRSKRGGACKVVLFEDAMRAEVLQRRQLADQLRNAIRNRDFVPYFQPQLDAGSLEIVGAEVLARWQVEPDRVLPPGAFLDLADELGLTPRIDEIVAAKAVDLFAGWQKDGLDLPHLSINVSGKRLSEKDFLGSIYRAVDANVRLNVELVESIYLEGADDTTMLVLDELRELGVGIEIDDFGTGHASLAGLTRVRPDRIKIDRQFVQPVVVDQQQRDLLRVFVQIAQTLDVGVVAEGVEDLDHVPILRDMGITTLQGFAFSRPVPAEKFRKMLCSGGLGLGVAPMPKIAPSLAS